MNFLILKFNSEPVRGIKSERIHKFLLILVLRQMNLKSKSCGGFISLLSVRICNDVSRKHCCSNVEDCGEKKIVTQNQCVDEKLSLTKVATLSCKRLCFITLVRDYLKINLNFCLYQHTVSPAFREFFTNIVFHHDIQPILTFIKSQNK